MRTSFPAYAQTIAPLHELMESIYKKAGSRKKRFVRKIVIGDSWGADHDLAFAAVKKQLAAATKLAYLKQDHIICLFTDASDTHWGSILTQIPLSRPRCEAELAHSSRSQVIAEEVRQEPTAEDAVNP